MKVKRTKLKCSNCGNEWVPRKKTVTQCPKCKAVLERNPPKVLEGGLVEA